MSEAKAPACGGMVYLNEKQSQEAAEIVLHTMQEIWRDMDRSRDMFAHRLRCADTIAELAKSLQTMKPIFWSGEEVPEC